MIKPTASKLALWHRRTLEVILTALALTGLVWIAATLMLDRYPDFDGPEIRSALHLDIIVHGILAYAALAAIGSLLGRHVPAGLETGRKVNTGIATLIFTGVLGATGLLLYYAGGEETRALSSLAHQIVGGAAIPLVIFHILKQVDQTRTRRAERSRAEMTPARD
jgi:hypothetical protein